MRLAFVLAAPVLLAAQQASAQCKVKTDSNEGQASRVLYGSYRFFHGNAPEEMRPGSIRIGSGG